MLVAERHHGLSALRPAAGVGRGVRLDKFRRGQAEGAFRIDLTPAWLTEALYGLLASGAWAVAEGRVARNDFTHMIAELLLGGALRDDSARREEP